MLNDRSRGLGVLGMKLRGVWVWEGRGNRRGRRRGARGWRCMVEKLVCQGNDVCL